MIRNAGSRRRFLKKFALLCGGSLMLSAVLTACIEDNYTALPSVIGIYFDDSAMQKVELRGNQNVPVHTQFTFVFSTDMDTGSPWTAVTFVDSASNPVDKTISWVDSRTLSVTPSADLSFNTDYVLTVEDASDSADNPLNPYASASAAFRTAGI